MLHLPHMQSMQSVPMGQYLVPGIASNPAMHMPDVPMTSSGTTGSAARLVTMPCPAYARGGATFDLSVLLDEAKTGSMPEPERER